MIRRARPAILAAVVTSMVLASGVAAEGGKKLIHSDLVGIPSGAPALAGVPGGGAPWFIDEGTATLREDGRLQIEVQGLVLASGVNPIATGVGIVSCGDGAQIITTDPVPFSRSGDAEVHARIQLPETCFAPVVFFAGVTANGPRWFAVNGG